MPFFSRNRKKERSPRISVIAFIDFENAKFTLRDDGQKIDMAGLMLALREIGPVRFALIFVPFGTFNTLPPQTNNLGFDIVVCQKAGQEGEKREDKVDAHISIWASKFLQDEDVSHIVLVTHDRHSLDIAREVIKSGKQLIYFGDEGKMNPELRNFIREFAVPVHSVPSDRLAML